MSEFDHRKPVAMTIYKPRFTVEYEQIANDDFSMTHKGHVVRVHRNGSRTAMSDDRICSTSKELADRLKEDLRMLQSVLVEKDDIQLYGDRELTKLGQYFSFDEMPVYFKHPDQRSLVKTRG